MVDKPFPDAREQILGRMPGSSAGGDPAGGALAGGAAAGLECPAPISARFEPGQLWDQFEAEFGRSGGKMIETSQVQEMISGLVWIDPVLVGAPFLPRDLPLANEIWNAETGLSMGDLAISQTGSVVVSSGPGKYRLSSLAPPVNIIFVKESRIVGTLAEAMTRLPGGNVVLVSGPSRTADIEGIMVRGVHGPRELTICRVKDW